MSAQISWKEARELTDQIKAAFVEHAMLPRPRAASSTPRRDRRCVYFITATTSCMVKIGVAESPRDRLKQLQTASPEPLELVAVIPGGGRALEHKLHEKLSRSHSHGEWFYPTDEVMAAVVDAGGDQ